MVDYFCDVCDEFDFFKFFWVYECEFDVVFECDDEFGESRRLVVRFVRFVIVILNFIDFLCYECFCYFEVKVWNECVVFVELLL